MANFKALRTTPATLTSALARKNLNLEIGEFQHVVRALDTIANLHGSMVTFFSTADSRLTREARAEKIAADREKGLQHKNLILNNVRHDLANRRAKLRADAIKKSGLVNTYPQGEEVRRALRELSQKERDAAINRAVDDGDAWLLASVINFPPLLTGKFSFPLNRLVDIFMERSSPELREQIEEVDNALQILALADETFDREAAEMSDPAAEARAAEDAKAITEAEAAFKAATGQGQSQ